MVTQRPQDPETESFAGLLLRHRGRTGLTQRDLAERLGTSRRSVQDWESGASHPGAERLQALILVLLEVGRADGWARGSGGARAVGRGAARGAADAHPTRRAVAGQSSRRARRFTDATDHCGPGRRAIRGAAAGLGRSARCHRLCRPCRRAGDPSQLGAGGALSAGGGARHGRHRQDRARIAVGPGRGTKLPVRVLAEPARCTPCRRVDGRRNQLPICPPPGAAGGRGGRLAVLLQLLRDRPSLLVLDNFETVLEPGQQQGRYRDGFAGYGRCCTPSARAGTRAAWW